MTGASRGIGRALAHALARRGDEVWLAARNREGLDSVRAEIESGGGRAVVLPLDLSRPESLSEAVAPLLEAGGPDALIQNAALLQLALFEEQAWDEVAGVLLTNVVGPMRLVRLVLPSMVRRRCGQIVFLGSPALVGMPTMAAYGASKGAMLAFSRCLRNELAGSGVRVMHVMVPAVVTGMEEQVTEFSGAAHARFAVQWPPVAGMSPEKFAHRLLAALDGRRDEVAIGLAGRFLTLQARGQRFVDRLFARFFRRL